MYLQVCVHNHHHHHHHHHRPLRCDICHFVSRRYPVGSWTARWNNLSPTWFFLLPPGNPIPVVHFISCLSMSSVSFCTHEVRQYMWVVLDQGNVQKFRVKQSLGFSSFCACSKCFIGTRFCVSKNEKKLLIFKQDYWKDVTFWEKQWLVMRCESPSTTQKRNSKVSNGPVSSIQRNAWISQ